MTLDWSVFDKIYCINLIHRDDRFAHVKNIFKKININAEFYRPEKDKESGLRGCFNSHLHILNEGYKKGYKNILVFEDDIIYNKTISQTSIDRCEDFMSKNKVWDILYLGAVPDLRQSDITIVEDGIYKLIGLCTHAVCYSNRFMRKMKNEKWSGIQLDYYYRKFNYQYAIYPSIFYQGGFKSDISNGIINKLSFLHETYFRLLEMYSYNIKLQPKLFMIVVLCFILKIVVQ